MLFLTLRLVCMIIISIYHNDSYDDMKDEIDAQVKKYYFETVTS